MLRCLFCKLDSSQSRSVEHVLPESLGNTTMMLPVTVVCDACNNYFARKVEGPFLALPPLLSLRHLEVVQNKRGSIPRIDRVSTSLGVEGRLWHPFGAQGMRTLSLPMEPDEARTAIQSPFKVAIPDRDDLPDLIMLGRFVAKVALESMAHRCSNSEPALRSLIDDSDLDPIRMHARYGAGAPWPVELRRIYPSDRMWSEGDENVQRKWESDFLVTPQGQLFFAVAIFGLELAINVLERDLTGYQGWRQATGVTTLLYPDGIPEDDS